MVWKRRMDTFGSISTRRKWDVVRIVAESGRLRIYIAECAGHVSKVIGIMESGLCSKMKTPDSFQNRALHVPLTGPIHESKRWETAEPIMFDSNPLVKDCFPLHSVLAEHPACGLRPIRSPQKGQIHLRVTVPIGCVLVAAGPYHCGRLTCRLVSNPIYVNRFVCHALEKLAQLVSVNSN